jgi:2-aminoadipate transaminase
MNIQTENQQFASRVQNVPTSFIREILKVANNPNVVSFAGGLPNPALFPIKELQESAERVFREKGTQALQYAGTEGYFPLREFISNRYKQRYNLDISPEQILIANGSQQALDLIAKVFVDPGDKVLLERPTYLGALQSLSMFQPEFKEVNLEEDGIDTKELDRQLSQNLTKLFYCIPNFQNPTGGQYSYEKRKNAAQILTNYETIIVEDDPYGEISFSGETLLPLYSYLPEQTILLGSFSKIIAPGLRLGWMVANHEIIKKAAIMKQASDLHSGNLSQYILQDYLINNDLDNHIHTIRRAYKNQCNVMLDCLRNDFLTNVKFTESKGGMFTWLTLPGGISSRELLQRALKENIIFVPGDTFYACDPDTQTLRLNYSNVEEETMRNAMKKLASLL